MKNILTKKQITRVRAMLPNDIYLDLSTNGKPDCVLCINGAPSSYVYEFIETKDDIKNIDNKIQKLRLSYQKWNNMHK